MCVRVLSRKDDLRQDSISLAWVLQYHHPDLRIVRKKVPATTSLLLRAPFQRSECSRTKINGRSRPSLRNQGIARGLRSNRGESRHEYLPIVPIIGNYESEQPGRQASRQGIINSFSGSSRKNTNLITHLSFYM